MCAPLKGSIVAGRAGVGWGASDAPIRRASPGQEMVAVTPVALLDFSPEFSRESFDFPAYSPHSYVRKFGHNLFFLCLIESDKKRKKRRATFINFFNMYCTALGYLLNCISFIVWKYRSQKVLLVYILTLDSLVLSLLWAFNQSRAGADWLILKSLFF